MTVLHSNIYLNKKAIIANVNFITNTHKSDLHYCDSQSFVYFFRYCMHFCTFKSSANTQKPAVQLLQRKS